MSSYKSTSLTPNHIATVTSLGSSQSIRSIMVDSTAQNVPDNSIRISIDRASSASRRLPLCDVSVLELIPIPPVLLVGAPRAVHLPTSLCKRLHPFPSTIANSLQRSQDRELTSCLLNGIICSSHRSYLETPTSSTRKEFILKLLSSDPSNYPDAPTGE